MKDDSLRPHETAPGDGAAPLRKQVEVPLSPGAAFDLFTRDMGRWWPGNGRSLPAGGGTLPRGVRVEPFEGGRIIETRTDGSQVPWARVTDWSPGRRFAFDWHVGDPEGEATQVAVVFAPVEGGTLVELTHSGFDRLPAGETMAARYDSGWDRALCSGYGGACRARAACKARAA